MSPALFLVLAACLVAGALGVVLFPSPVRSALSLVLTLFFIAVMFLLLDAQLVAALQVVVYAGAIMVLFLFVIMLLNLQADPPAMARLGIRITAGLGASLFLLAVVYVVTRSGGAMADPRGMATPLPAEFGRTQGLAELLFTRFLFAFEVTSILLLVAIIGAVVLAKKKVT
jgi:NADH-quinone oxidoreductase subunit J